MGWLSVMSILWDPLAQRYFPAYGLAERHHFSFKHMNWIGGQKKFLRVFPDLPEYDMVFVKALRAQ